jgi:hypothetical protein
MQERRGKFTPEFRDEAVKMVIETSRPITEIARRPPPADIDALNHKISYLEQQAVDLRLQLEERDQDLAAARAANRELMAQLNATVRHR